jgi:hypothetical protein
LSDSEISILGHEETITVLRGCPQPKNPSLFSFEKPAQCTKWKEIKSNENYEC